MLSSRPDLAWDFYRWLQPAGPYYLERLESEGAGRPVSKRYSSEESGPFKKFISVNNSDAHRRNIHFLPNAEFLIGSRSKANMTGVRMLHVDLDCKDYPGTMGEQCKTILDLLLDAVIRPEGIPAPSCVWFTGGGYQALWVMAEPISVTEAERLNKGLLVALRGAKGPHDASRLLRLPGTINWLNAKKRAAGREPAMAEMIAP